MQFDVKATNLDKVMDLIAQMSGEQMRQAQANALNILGAKMRKDMISVIRSSFDRPSAFITSAPKYFAARPDKLNVTVLPTMHSEGEWVSGGKVGVDPQDVLQAQEFGGRRRDKKSEVVLRRAGLLPAGYQTAIPRQPFPGSTDAYGNISGAFMQQLLSYLQLYGEQGYRANMSAAKRRELNLYGKTGLSKRAQQQSGPRMGRRYFVAGTRVESRFEGGEHKVGPVRLKGTAHLQPGVWANVGTGQLKPVLIFVRTPTYSPRLSMEGVFNLADRKEFFEKALRGQIRELMKV